MLTEKYPQLQTYLAGIILAGAQQALTGEQYCVLSVHVNILLGISVGCRRMPTGALEPDCWQCWSGPRTASWLRVRMRILYGVDDTGIYVIDYLLKVQQRICCATDDVQFIHHSLPSSRRRTTLLVYPSACWSGTCI